jgi:hypothetical protein
VKREKLNEREWRLLSRRDCRTQPGVLTPGTDLKNARLEGAQEIDLAFRSATHRLAIILRRPFGAGSFWLAYLGLKPRAESYSPFGTKAIPDKIAQLAG